MGLNHKRRLQDPNNIRALCPSLIEIKTVNDRASGAANQRHYDFQKIYIAHFFIKEYLESERIRYQRAAIFSLASVTAHIEIFQILFIHQFDLFFPRPHDNKALFERFPLAEYSKWFWYDHYETAMNPVIEGANIIIRLFNQHCLPLKCGEQSANQQDLSSIDVDLALDRAIFIIYCASYLGLDDTLQNLMEMEMARMDPCLFSRKPTKPSFGNESILLNTICPHQGGTFLSTTPHYVVQQEVDMAKWCNSSCAMVLTFTSLGPGVRRCKAHLRLVK